MAIMQFLNISRLLFVLDNFDPLRISIIKNLICKPENRFRIRTSWQCLWLQNYRNTILIRILFLCKAEPLPIFFVVLNILVLKFFRLQFSLLVHANLLLTIYMGFSKDKICWEELNRVKFCHLTMTSFTIFNFPIESEYII